MLSIAGDMAWTIELANGSHGWLLACWLQAVETTFFTASAETPLWLLTLSVGSLVALLIALLLLYQKTAGERDSVKRIENALSSLMPVLEQTVWGIYWKDRHGRYVGCNQAFASLAGLAEIKKIAGMRDHDLPWAGQSSYMRRREELVFTRGQPLQPTLEKLITSQGECWFELQRFPIFDERGEVAGILVLVRDIQDQIADSQELRRLKSITENVPYGMAILDRQGVIVYCNGSFAAIHGYEMAEVIGANLYKMSIVPEELMQERIRELLQDPGIPSLQVEHVRKDGSAVPVLLTASHVPGEGGIPAFTSVTAMDITRLKAAENALRESEERFRALAEYIPGTVYLCRNDERWTMLYLNDEVEWLTGYPKADFLSNKISFKDLYHPDDVQHIRTTVEDALANQEPFRIVYRLKHPSGEYRWVEEVGTGIYLGDETDLIEGFLQDITQRKRSEQRLNELNDELNNANEALRNKNQELNQTVERLNKTNAEFMAGNRELVMSQMALRASETELRESREQYRRLVDLAQEGIATADRNENLTFVNPYLARVLGYTPQELYGRKVISLCDEDSAATLTQQVEQRLTGEFSTYELRMFTKEREIKHFQVSAGPLYDEENEFEGSLAVFSDITELKQFHESLLTQQKDESVATLAGGVAHDFNNILVGVMGSAAMLHDLLGDDDEALELCNMISTAAERMSDLTGQLLAYARGGRYQPRTVHVEAVVQDSVAILRNTLPAGVAVETFLSAEIPPVQADLGQLSQVFLNLLVNAGESMSKSGGVLSVSVGRFKHQPTRDHSPISKLPAGEYVKAVVSDTGSGMPPAVLKRIFDPFYSTKGQGRGLGLAAVQGIITNHQGVIWADSIGGQGTTFTLLLPASDKQVEPAPTNNGATPNAAGCTVLTVDDDELVLGVTSMLLDRSGFKVLTAQGGHAGWEAYLENEAQIQVVLADLQMPDMSGRELCERIRDRNPQVRVLISSGFSEDEVLRLMKKIDFDGYVNKPYRIEDLTQAINSVMSSPRD